MNLYGPDYRRALMVDYASHFIGTRYRWGGDDPLAGFDCSGFVIECLQAVGLLGDVDTTADGLLQLFRPQMVNLGYAGCLAFWLDAAGRATHTMLMIDPFHVLGAAGGGSGTRTAEDAAGANAFIKVRPLAYRAPQVPVIADPFKGVAERAR